jgi:hypothetical protein
VPATQGILLPSVTSLGTEVVYPINTYARNISINDAPLASRLPRVAIGADKFKMGTRTVRSRTRTLGAALADNTNTTVNLTDVSDIMVGDVLELASGERVEVTADPTISNATSGAGTLTVRRGIASTTAAAQNNATTAILVGNSRTGGEVNQTAARQVMSYTDQAVQTFQFPVQIAGKVNAMTAISLAPGSSDPFNQEVETKSQEFMRDVEYAMLFGRYEYAATGNRSKMGGLRHLVGNVTTSPTNASAYKPSDFVRDVITPIAEDGGYPTTLVCALNFVQAFATWGHPVQAFTDGTDVYGLPIRRMIVPFLGFDLELIPHPQLASFTAFCLSLSTRAGAPVVRTRYLRQESLSLRGNRGDAIEGDIIGDFAIEVDDLNHHAFVSGITGFSV